MSYKGLLTLSLTAADITPQDPDIHGNSTFVAIVRYGNQSKMTQQTQGSTSGPSWGNDKVFQFDYDSTTSHDITIAVTATTADKQLSYNCGKTAIDLEALFSEQGRLDEAGRFVFKDPKFAIRLPSVIMPYPHDDILFYTTVHANFAFRGQKDIQIASANLTTDYLAPPPELLFNASVSPPTYDAPPQDYPYDNSLEKDNVEKLQSKSLDVIPPTYDGFAPPDYQGATYSAQEYETTNYQDDPDDPNACPRNLPSGVIKPDRFDYGYYSLTPGKTVDLHLPLYPTSYLGQTKMQSRTLHTGVTGPNSEKNGENDPSQCLYMEKTINSALSMDEVRQYRNISQRSALLPLEQRYNDHRYHEQWRGENPHALFGACKALHFYFTACTPDFPGFLVGIQQEFDTGIVYSGGISKDSMKKYVDFGYTQINIQKQHGPRIKLNPNVTVESFHCEDYDFISQFDVLSCASGILAVRCFTATGQCSKLLFNRGFVNPAYTDKDHHLDFKNYPDFKLESSPFIPRYFPSSQGKFGALAYFSTFSRSITPNISSTLNIHDPAQHAPITESIGGIRAYITHPIVKKEISSTPVDFEAEATPVIMSAVPVKDNFIIDIDDAPPATPGVSSFNVVAATSSSSSNTTIRSSSGCGTDNIVPNDFFPAFIWPVLANMATLIAIGVVGLYMGLPLLAKTADVTLCTPFKLEATLSIISFFVCLALAAALIFFSFVVIMRQCCGGNGSAKGTQKALYVVYGIFLVICIVTSGLGLKGAISFGGEGCIDTSQRIVLIVLHGLVILSALGFLGGAIANHGLKRFWAEVFIVQWGIFILVCIAICLLLLVAIGAGGKKGGRRR